MIQISEPSLEALIQQRLTEGGFDNVESLLRQALTEPPLRHSPETEPPPQTGAELVAALQRSPLAGIDFDFEAYRGPMPVRLVEF